MIDSFSTTGRVVSYINDNSVERERVSVKILPE